MIKDGQSNEIPKKENIRNKNYFFDPGSQYSDRGIDVCVVKSKVEFMENKYLYIYMCIFVYTYAWAYIFLIR
jgi:hypothetical protein